MGSTVDDLSDVCSVALGHAMADGGAFFLLMEALYRIPGIYSMQETPPPRPLPPQKFFRGDVLQTKGRVGTTKIVAWYRFRRYVDRGSIFLPYEAMFLTVGVP